MTNGSWRLNSIPKPGRKWLTPCLNLRGIPSFLKRSVTAIQLMLPLSFLAQAHELFDSQIPEDDLIAQAEGAAVSPEPAASEEVDDDHYARRKDNLTSPRPGNCTHAAIGLSSVLRLPLMQESADQRAN